tara:strand:- start:942 stop:1415 length:474 start_codon:yes stop_codon:yes gene_type:complete
MKIVKNKILVILLLFILTGCCSLKSPVNRYECQKQRASEKIYVLTKKFPELLQPTDTIRLSDTIRTNNVLVDTSFVFGNVNDTIIIQRDKLIIKYLKKDSIIYLMGECIADTIYLTREIPIEKIVVSKPAISKKIKDWLIIGIIFIFGLFFIRKLIK